MILEYSAQEEQQSALVRNEEEESAAFDQIAITRSRIELTTSNFTFSRYRSAVMAEPIFQGYPDLIFSCIGKRFHCKSRIRKPLLGLKILDLGAGDGSWSVILAEQGAEVVSVEISPKQVELARERMRLHNLQWDARICSAYRLKEEFPSESFHLVFGTAILHHLTSRLDLVYHGIHSLLKKDGLATFVEPFSGSRLFRTTREKLTWIVPIDAETPGERPLVPADIVPLRDMFAEVETDYFDLFAKIPRRVFRSSFLARSLFQFDRFLLRNKALRSYATMVFIGVRK